MHEMLKILIKQSLINEKLLQAILICLGVKEDGVQEITKSIEKHIDKEIKWDE